MSQRNKCKCRLWSLLSLHWEQLFGFSNPRRRVFACLICIWRSKERGEGRKFCVWRPERALRDENERNTEDNVLPHCCQEWGQWRVLSPVNSGIRNIYPISAFQGGLKGRWCHDDTVLCSTGDTRNFLDKMAAKRKREMKCEGRAVLRQNIEFQDSRRRGIFQEEVSE